MIPAMDSRIVGLHRLDGPGDRLAVATGLDGFLVVADGKVSAQALPGQLGLVRVRRVMATAEETLFEGGDGPPANSAAAGRASTLLTSRIASVPISPTADSSGEYQVCWPSRCPMASQEESPWKSRPGWKA